MLSSLAALAPHIVSALSVLTLVGQIVAGVVLVALVSGWFPQITTWVSRRGLVLMCIVAVVGTLGSLYFSEIAGWTPCRLCWFQRIFLYPQSLMLPLAVWRRDRSVAQYILALSIIGIVIALLHYGEQVMAVLAPPATEVPCDETGVSCARTPFFHFGYITIPLMAATAFLLTGLGSVLMLRSK